MEDSMRKFNLSWSLAVLAVALLGIVAAAPSANAQCLANPGVTEISAWNYEFFVEDISSICWTTRGFG